MDKLERLETEFVSQLSELQLDAQERKDLILQELTEITPESILEIVNSEVKEEIQEQPQQPEFTADEYVKQADGLFSEKCYEDAIAAYNQAVKIQPDEPVAWLKRG
ncbi:MAG: tetratricopeptide repeat protein, partial [Nostoc sp.]